MRTLLSASDDDAFAARVLAAARESRGEVQWWEVLTAWARPGLVAASLVAAAAALWSLAAPRHGSGSGQLGDPLPAAGAQAAVPAYLVSGEILDVDAVMAALVENE